MNRYIFVLAILSVACAAKLDWRVIGGSSADDGQFPYQVSIQQYYYHICSGSILNEQWVLTAAECVNDLTLNDVMIIAGSNKLNEGGYSYKVIQAIAHNEYNMYTMENNIALVKIDGRIAFSAKVQPIPLETSDVAAGADLILSGWGFTSMPGYLSDDLQFLPVKAISSKDCKSRHASDSGLSVGSTQLCTLTKSGEGACHGDSGSLVAHNGKVAGILSWIRPCAMGYPDVFTRVSSFVDWINETMED